MECSICYEVKELKQLHSNHYFCNDCFNKLIDFNIYQCPLCRFQFRDKPIINEELIRHIELLVTMVHQTIIREIGIRMGVFDD